MCRPALDRYLIELVEREDTWIVALRYMLTDYSMQRQPWPSYRDEDQAWV